MLCKGKNIFDPIPKFLSGIVESEFSGFFTIQDFKDEIKSVQKDVTDGKIDPCNFWKIILVANNVHLKDLDFMEYLNYKDKFTIRTVVVEDSSFVENTDNNDYQAIGMTYEQHMINLEDQAIKPVESKKDSSSKIMVVVVALIAIVAAYYFIKKN
jgi:hypothetical protein